MAKPTQPQAQVNDGPLISQGTDPTYKEPDYSVETAGSGVDNIDAPLPKKPIQFA
jgi:hypothetical protein